MNYDTTTSLNEIRSEHPCAEGWMKILRHLGKTKADDDLVELVEVLDSNGFSDATWALGVPSLDRLSRHFRATLLERVLHFFEQRYPNDMRLREAIVKLRDDKISCFEFTDAWSVALRTARSKTLSLGFVDGPEFDKAFNEERAEQEKILREMIEGTEE